MKMILAILLTTFACVFASEQATSIHQFLGDTQQKVCIDESFTLLNLSTNITEDILDKVDRYDSDIVCILADDTECDALRENLRSQYAHLSFLSHPEDNTLTFFIASKYRLEQPTFSNDLESFDILISDVNGFIGHLYLSFNQFAQEEEVNFFGMIKENALLEKVPFVLGGNLNIWDVSYSLVDYLSDHRFYFNHNFQAFDDQRATYFSTIKRIDRCEEDSNLSFLKNQQESTSDAYFCGDPCGSNFTTHRGLEFEVKADTEGKTSVEGKAEISRERNDNDSKASASVSVKGEHDRQTGKITGSASVKGSLKL